MTDPLISAAELAASEALILDATYYLPADQARARAEYRAGHLPGARFFDIDRVSDPEARLPHMLPPPEVFGPAMAALGIDGSRPIVVYDRSVTHFSAPRVWFTLQAYGLEARVLDGGLSAWTGPLVSGEETGAVAERAWTLEASRVIAGEELARDLDRLQILDARGAARFEGRAAEPRPGLISGHMPGARNIPFDQLTSEGRFLAPEALRALFAGKTGPETVLTCGSGMTAAVLALGLARIGQRARLYDGSWAEWGQGKLGPIVGQAARS